MITTPNRSPVEPTVVPQGTGTVLHAFGDQVTVKLSAAQTGGAFALCEDITPPGGGPPLHYHLHEDELFMLQEGRVRYFLEAEWIDLEPGAVVFAPRKSIHTFRNVGDRPCRQLIMTTPSGFETFFARCATEFARPGGPDLARLADISAEHGIHFVEHVSTG